MPRPRVVIVDDHRMVLEGLARFLAHSCDVIETLGDSSRVRDTVRQLEPDVLILDISMPNASGLEVLRQVSQQNTACKTIVLTMFAEPRLAVDALKAGASGFVLKESSADELLTAVRVVLDGGTYLPKDLTKEIVTLMVGVENSRDALSPVEQEMLRLIVQGQRAKEIAAALGMTTRSVETLKYRLMRQLQVHSTAELVRHTIERRLLPF